MLFGRRKSGLLRALKDIMQDIKQIEAMIMTTTDQTKLRALYVELGKAYSMVRGGVR